jgi:hypothetical protein
MENIMSQQKFNDESNWKHEPHAKHYVDDKFEKGNDIRNWKKNVDEEIEASADSDKSTEKSKPPGAPDRTPVEDADGSKKKIGDPRSPTKNKPRLKQ